MKPLVITFLGACSSGDLLISRTATALTFGSTSWLVDCAAGTRSQILRAKELRIANFSRVFITHMHTDHVQGLIPLIKMAMSNPLSFISPSRVRMNLYGPPDLRSFVRRELKTTQEALIGQYAVHELLQKGEHPSVDCSPESLHANEAPGRDIEAGKDGLWRNFTQHKEWSVDAGPLNHTISCLGYVFREADSSSLHHRAYKSYRVVKATAQYQQKTPQTPLLDIPGRKIVILGDTCDSSAMIPIAMDASALVHESNNVFIPREVAEKAEGLKFGGDEDSVRKKALSRGHSTAEMAGQFAKTIRARRLYLNHFSKKFSRGEQSLPTPDNEIVEYQGSNAGASCEATIVMDVVEQQASEAWGLGTAVIATDLLTDRIPGHEV